MLISKQQQYVLDILKRLSCAHKKQLEKLLKARFFPEGKLLPRGFWRPFCGSSDAAASKYAWRAKRCFCQGTSPIMCCGT